MALLIAVFFGALYIVDLDQLRKGSIQKIATWSGGQIRYSSAFNINYFPNFQNIRLIAEDVEVVKIRNLHGLKKIYAKQLAIDVNVWKLLFGLVEIDTLHLTTPNFILDEDEFNNNTQQAHPLHLLTTQTLSQNLIDRLKISNGTLQFVSGHKVSETLRHIHATWSFSNSKQKIKGYGEFVWRKEKTLYNYISLPMKGGTENTQNRRLSYSFSNPFIEAKFSGNTGFQPDVYLGGTANVTISNMRALSKWLKHPLPHGRGLEIFSAKGTINWRASRLTFVNSQISLDNNYATGTVSVDYTSAKPKLEGTLAFNTLSLQPYVLLPNSSSSIKRPHGITFELQKYFDADLRLSIREISLGGFKTRDNALTLSLTSEMLLIDVAQVGICNGLASGQFKISHGNNQIPIVKINGSAQRIETHACHDTFFVNSPFHGKTAVDFNLQAQIDLIKKTKTIDLLKAMDGKIFMAISEAGKLNVALPELFIGSSNAQTHSLNKATPFSSLKARMQISGGKNIMPKVIINTKNSTYIGSGVWHFLKNTIDYKITKQIPSIQSASLVPQEQNDIALRVKGSWAQPNIQIWNSKTKQPIN
ncbi:MAG: hypothetical protein AAF228_06660 [Pseudomonadota bacterium]